MQSKRYTLIFTGTLLLFLLISFWVSYTNFSSVRYFEYAPEVLFPGKENTVVYSVDIVSEADSFLANLKSSEFDEEYEKLRKEYYELDQFIRAKKRLSDDKTDRTYRYEFTEKEAKNIVEQYNITESDAQKRMELVSLCMRQLHTASESQKYISSVKKKAEKMNETAVFSSETRKRILHTGYEFFRLENIEISAVSDKGISMVFSDRITDVLALFLSAISAFVFSLKIRSTDLYRKRKNFGVFSWTALFTVSVCLMYVLNYICADMTIGVGSAERSVQSVHNLVQCPMAVSVGTFWEIRTLVKTAACMTVFLTALSFFLTERKAVFISVLLVLAIYDFLRIRYGSSVVITSMWRPENILGCYGSARIFGEYFSTHTLFGIYAVLLTAASVFVSAGCIRSSVIAASQKAEKEYFEEIKSKYNESRLIRHDIKNHLSAIAVLLDSGNTEGARKYIGDISDELESIKPPVKTGSDVLDALLFRKYSNASENGIKIYTEFLSDFETTRFSDYDMCSIFSNLLDNAFEACSKLDDSRKFVSLSVREQMNMVCITCENHFLEIKRSSDGFVSLKPDKSYHGLGLKSIAKIAQKYGGSVDIETEDGIFSVSVLLMKKP